MNAEYICIWKNIVPHLRKEKRALKPTNELNKIVAISSITHFCVLFIFSKQNHVLPVALVLPTKYRGSYGPISS